MTKISSLNINGIRAGERKGFSEWIQNENPDIICLQELKAMEDQIPDEIRELEYHQYYHPAEKKGYSGVGILTKEEPKSVQIGMDNDWIDREGRVIMSEFDRFRIFSVYVPSGTSGDERQQIKYQFMDEFFDFINPYLEDEKPTIFAGDFNIAHTEIDIHNPVANKKNSGFLPEERAWFTEVLNSGFVDAFRTLHTDEKDLYSWWSYRAASKKRNKGWRIDYHLVNPATEPFLEKGRIEFEQNMSDHAPVTLTYDF